ncbi:MAG: hypothetical protein J0M33_21850 [Anaerolineae bacterium]|nr:hypothetical protein [Anaerolineae bacterium]
MNQTTCIPTTLRTLLLQEEEGSDTISSGGSLPSFRQMLSMASRGGSLRPSRRQRRNEVAVPGFPAISNVIKVTKQRHAPVFPPTLLAGNSPFLTGCANRQITSLRLNAVS